MPIRRPAHGCHGYSSSRNSVLWAFSSLVVLAAAAAHAKSGMGVDGAGYLLLFHAVAVLSGVALLQQGLLLRPLVLGVLSGWVLGSALFAGDIALRASSATHYFPWRRQPAESYSFWHGSRSPWLPFGRCCAARSEPNVGAMMTRLEMPAFQPNPDREMDVGMGVIGKE